MSEAVEYRLKSIKAMILATGSIAPGFTGALAGLLVKNSPFTAALLAATGILLMYAMLSMAYGIRYDGYNRAFWSRFTDFSDPPLKEWEARLESEGAFATSEVAD